MGKAGVALVLAGLCLAGCTASNLGPTQTELRARWDAQNVVPQNYKSDLLAYFRTYLNNPEGVRGAAVSAPFLKEVGPGERYVVCVRFNARDTRGKYMGAKEAVAVFVVGKLDRFAELARERRATAEQLAAEPRLKARAPRASCARTRASRRSRNWRRSGASGFARTKTYVPAGASRQVRSSNGTRSSVQKAQGHLTLRFSAEDFPRFSTSSY